MEAHGWKIRSVILSTVDEYVKIEIKDTGVWNSTGKSGQNLLAVFFNQRNGNRFGTRNRQKNP